MKPASLSKKPLTTSDYLAMITQAALVLALALVACRLTVSEQLRDVSATGLTADLPSHNPLATTTLILNALCWLPAILVLVRRAIDPQYTLRFNWSLIPMALVSIWIMISCRWASDKFAAVVSASTWCSAMALGWAMSQLVRSWGRFRLVVSLFVGLLLVYIGQSIIYRYLELPATREYWKEMTAQYGSKNPADQFNLRQMEININNGSLLGFYHSANTFAAMLVMGIIVSLGYGIQRLRDKDELGFSVGLIIPAAIAMLALALTSSKTAIAGLVLCAILFSIFVNRRDLFAQRYKLFYWAGIVLALLMTGVVILIGTKTGGLVQDSLNFRWHYWVGSWGLFKSEPWRGVGWNNFGSNYLAFRMPQAAEEIKDPHNIVIKLLTETGLFGALFFLAWLGSTAFEMIRPSAPRGAAASSSSIQLPVLVSISYLVLRILSEPPLPLADYWIDFIKIILFAVLICFGMLMATARDSKAMKSDDRPAPYLLAAVIIAIGGFWLHAMVDFAFTEIGPMLAMMCLIGSILGIRHHPSANSRPNNIAAYLSLGGSVIVLIVYIAMLVVPIALSESKAADAKALADQKRFSDGAKLLRDAYAGSPVANFDYSDHAADMLMQAGADKAQIVGLLSDSIAADPASETFWIKRARFELMTKDSPELVVSDYAQSLRRNPANILVRRELADYLVSIGRLLDAAGQYQLLIDYNNKLDATEPRRLSEATVNEIKQKIELLKAEPKKDN